MYVIRYVQIHIHTPNHPYSIYSRTHTPTQAHMHTYTRTQTHARTYTNVHTCSQSRCKSTWCSVITCVFAAESENTSCRTRSVKSTSVCSEEPVTFRVPNSTVVTNSCAGKCSRVSEKSNIFYRIVSYMYSHTLHSLCEQDI